MRLLLGLVLFVAATIQAHAEPPEQRFVAIAFHGIGDEVADLEPDSVRSRVLVQFFEWLKGTGQRSRSTICRRPRVAFGPCHKSRS